MKVASTQLKELIATGKPIVVDFFAEWCGPCKLLASGFEKLAEEFAGKATFVKVDADSEHELMRELGVSALPTVMFFNNGSKVDFKRGLQPMSVYRTSINEIIEVKPPVA